MAVLERERLHGATSARRREARRPWEEWPTVTAGGPPEVPPAFYWDDDGGDDGDGESHHPWARRILAAIGIVVLLCMVFSPVAADLLGGHSPTPGGVTTSTGDR